MKFTVKDVASLTLPEGKTDVVYWDHDIAGFGLRIRAGGKRTWIYRYRIGHRQRSIVLGSATAVPLALARKNAGELEAKVRLGGDPAVAKEAARIEAETPNGSTPRMWDSGSPSNVAKESGEPTANRVRSTLSMLYSWALREGIKLPEGNTAAMTAIAAVSRANLDAIIATNLHYPFGG